MALADGLGRPYRSVKPARWRSPWVVGRRNITHVLERVRPTARRGSDPEREAGLSEDRLTLVHRYMVDAEQAEALGGEAVEKEEASAHEPALGAAAQEHARREDAERTGRRRKRERRRAAKLAAEAASTEHRADPAAKTPERAPSTDLKDVVSAGGEAPVSEDGRQDPRKAARARKALVKADKRTAKQAARQIAALEKREARERKALAKAAARRKTA
jgi:hypothetical protein